MQSLRKQEKGRRQVILEIIGAAIIMFLVGWGVLVAASKASDLFDDWGK